ncbi:MAG: SDR family oxidoreductase [Alphaproteobacteria bacterium]|nr:SDR family oxidoreductase [Alphaproteobacteria bacterium]
MSSATLSLKGRRVVVIGGASGIGFAVAALARELGAEVLIASSREDNVAQGLARLRESPGGAVSGEVVDLRREASVAGFFESLGVLDHLAITAGDWAGGMAASTRDLDLDAARARFEVRFWGVLAAVKHAVPHLAPEGSITLTSGMLTHRPQKGAVLAVGGAVESLAKALAMDLAPIRVNAVCPGYTLAGPVLSMAAERVAAATSRLPVPRAATATEAAQAYIYAMLNSYVTGQVLPVDGGGLLV